MPQIVFDKLLERERASGIDRTRIIANILQNELLSAEPLIGGLVRQR